ncbi:hypothetical protein JZO73_03850 [Enterococcus plantarum]|nr:hypothetical protein [Enterococcus plantarum]
MKLNSNGTNFERGMEQLGRLLGYKTGNPSGEAEPDAWWVLNDNYCMITESKIYDDVDT